MLETPTRPHQQAVSTTSDSPFLSGRSASSWNAAYPRAAVVMPLAEQRGGCETMLMRFLRANLAGPRVEYVVGFLEEGPMVSAVREMGYNVHAFPAGRLRETPRLVKTVLDMRDWLKRENIQVGMAWMEKAQLYLGPAAKMAGVPSVWWIHSIPKDQWMNKLATRLPSDAVFCVGTTAEAGQKTMKPLRPTRVMSIGIDLSQFDPATAPTQDAARRALGLPLGVPIIGMVARLQRWKGVHIFVQAAAEVAKKRPDAAFVVVGGDHFDELDYPAELEKLTAELDMTEKIRFVGLQKNVPTWIQAFDIFVHASFDEPTGAVILEALSLGKAVIAAKTGGPMELANDGKDALFVEPGKPELLTAAIERLLSDDELRERLCAAAPAQAKRFGIDQLAIRVAEGLKEFAGAGFGLRASGDSSGFVIRVSDVGDAEDKQSETQRFESDSSEARRPNHEARTIARSPKQGDSK